MSTPTADNQVAAYRDYRNAKTMLESLDPASPFLADWQARLAEAEATYNRVAMARLRARTSGAFDDPDRDKPRLLDEIAAVRGDDSLS